MRTLSTLIFLSLLASCGQKVNPSGPDPVVPLTPQNLSESNAVSADGKVALKLVEAYDIKNLKELTSLNIAAISDGNFFRQYKNQYKQKAFGISIVPWTNTWYFPATRSDKIRLSFNMQSSGSIEFLEFEARSSKDAVAPKSYKHFGPFSDRLDFEMEIPKGDDEVVVSLVDFRTRNGQSLKTVEKRNKKMNYTLHIEDGNKRTSLIFPAETPLIEAIKSQDLDLNIDSEGGIASLLGLESAGDSVDINSYKDETGFWKIANSPNQNLFYKPMAGQEILIKYITMGQLRKNVATKISRQVDFKTLSFTPRTLATTYSWKLENVTITELVPTQKKTARNAMSSIPIPEVRHIACKYWEFSLGHTPKTQEFGEELSGLVGEKGVVNMKLSTKKITYGTKNDSCFSRPVKDGKRIKFGLTTKNVQSGVLIKGTLVETQKL